jgi:hypothetical protein
MKAYQKMEKMPWGAKSRRAKTQQLGKRKEVMGKSTYMRPKDVQVPNGGPISLTDDLKGVRRSAGHG